MLGWLADATVWNRYAAAASVIGGFATGFGILIGGVSLLLILFQTKHSGRVSNSIAALESHKDYIRLCLDHPELSSSTLMKAYLKIDSFSGILDVLTPDSERALWFMSYVLFAMEQSIISVPGDKFWRTNIEDQLGYHSELLEEVWGIWRSHYTPEMDQVVTSVLNRPFLGSEIDIGRPST
jgi:hypothetical protein